LTFASTLETKVDDKRPGSIATRVHEDRPSENDQLTRQPRSRWLWAASFGPSRVGTRSAMR
jgi:hypothetical protein